MTDVAQLVVGIILAIFASTLGYAYNLRLKDKQEMKDKDKLHLEDVSDLKDRITKLEARLVTENRVREIVREELQGISEDVRELKVSIHSLLDLVKDVQLTMAEERGFRRALDKPSN
jgi:hypothetical protein